MRSQTEQRIFLVTGKGGVGKSTVAMALARQLASRGERTLLAELGEYSYFEFALGLRSSYKSVQISENLDFSLWSGEACLRDYIRHLVPVRAIADLFFDNKIMKSFVRAAPGLKELAVLGKLTSGIRKWGPKFEYENVVVDAYASGHFLALLNAPKGLGELIESGPMGEQSRAIMKVLSNPESVRYIVVSLPEDLPVSESIELKNSIKSLTNIEPSIFLNQFYQFKNDCLKDVDFPLANFISQLDSRSLSSLERLQSTSPNVRTINFIKESGSANVIRKISESIEVPQ